MKTKVTCIKCPNCKDIIYSRSRHDFRSCSCELIAIDGGFDYTRIIGYPEGKPFTTIINASKSQLYNDWSKQIDKYGVIKNEKNKS